MKLKIIFLLSAIVIAGADDCTVESAQECVDHFLDSILEYSSDEDVCSHLKLSVDCLRDALEECVDDDAFEDAEKGLHDLEKVLDEYCVEDSDLSPSSMQLKYSVNVNFDKYHYHYYDDDEEEHDDNDEDEEDDDDQDEDDNDIDEEEIKECLSKVKEYMPECMQNPSDNLMSIVNKTEGEEVNVNLRKCLAYHAGIKCVMRKIEDDCGSDAADMFDNATADVPEGIKKLCEDAGEAGKLAIALLE